MGVLRPCVRRKPRGEARFDPNKIGALKSGQHLQADESS